MQLHPLSSTGGGTGVISTACWSSSARSGGPTGLAVAERIQAAAERVPGLMVPVEVTVDVETFRSRFEQPGDGYDQTLEGRLVAAAVLDTPTPDDLPGTPLSRLNDAI